MSRRPPTYDSLAAEYRDLWSRLTPRPRRTKAVAASITRIVAGRDRYEAVTAATGVPWYVVGVIHQLECGGRWDQHLHNGDPLTARTRRVPANRPSRGSPPFTWIGSAVDAVQIKGWHRMPPDAWTIERVCYELERYNGWGYRQYHPDTLSPYLWAGTTHYARGKYVADGQWDASAVSAQLGAMLLIRALVDAGHVTIAEDPDTAASPLPAPVLPPAPGPADTPEPRSQLTRSRTLLGAMLAGAGWAVDQMQAAAAGAFELLPRVYEGASQFHAALDHVSRMVAVSLPTWIVVVGLLLVVYARVTDHLTGKTR